MFVTRLKHRQPTVELTSEPQAGPAGRLLVLLAVVFLLKLVVLAQLSAHPLTAPDSGLDTTAYADLARQVVSGNLGLGPGLYFVSPLYIYFLAALLATFDSFTFVKGVQIGLGTAAVWFMFLTARTWFGERAAWITAVLAGLTGLFTFYEVLILQSSIDVFLTSAALYFLARSFSRLKAGATYRSVHDTVVEVDAPVTERRHSTSSRSIWRAIA